LKGRGESNRDASSRPHKRTLEEGRKTLKKSKKHLEKSVPRNLHERNPKYLKVPSKTGNTPKILAESHLLLPSWERSKGTRTSAQKRVRRNSEIT